MPVPENIFAVDGGAEEEAETHLILEGQGNTFLEALQAVQQHMEKRLFLGHLRTIIISDQLAGEYNLTKLLDAIFRDYSVNRDTAIVVAQGSAKDIISITPRSSPNVSQYLTDYLSDFSRNVVRMNTDMGLYLVEQEGWGMETVLAYLVANEEENTIMLIGGALVRDGDMVGTLSKEEVRAAAMVKGLLTVTAYTLPIASGYATLQTFVQDSDLIITPQANGVRVRLTLGAEYTVQEYFGPGDIEDVETQMTQALTEQMTQDLTSSIHKLQEANVDIYGIGQKVHYKHNKLWRQLDWDAIFPTIPIEVAVQVERRKVGIRE